MKAEAYFGPYQNSGLVFVYKNSELATNYVPKNPSSYMFDKVSASGKRFLQCDNRNLKFVTK